MEQKLEQRLEKFTYGKPFGTRVIIKADEAKEVTPGGIIIPETAKERPQFGTVMAVGSLVTEDVSDGDRVVYGKNAGVPLIIGGITYYVMQEREIFMKLDQGELDSILSDFIEKPADKEIPKTLFVIEKGSYAVGEEIKIRYEAEVQCRVDVSVLKKGKQISSERCVGSKGVNEITLTATEKMFPEVTIELVLMEYFGKATDVPLKRNSDFKIEVYKK